MEVVVSGSGVANGETERFSASRLILEATQAEAAESLGAKAKAEPFQLIDSLTYIDGVDTALLSRAQALIQDELKRVSKRPAEYLKELPKAEDVSFENCPLSARAFERLQRQGGGEATSSAFDLARDSNVAEPEGKEAKSLQAWKKAVDEGQAKLEHQSVKAENLELLRKHGASVWRASNMQLEGLCTVIDKETEEIEREIEGINRERKVRMPSSVCLSSSLCHATTHRPLN